MRSKIVKSFLQKNAREHFVQRYDDTMQCHVLVGSDGGTRDGVVWSDGIETWYPFVINDAMSNNKAVTYNFDKHVEGIGLTGWDYEAKCSRWVAFDFDSVIGHKSGLQESELKEILDNVKDIDWVTVYTSTGGRGYHLYVDLEPVIETENRSEHSAVARAILHKLSALTGFDFKDKVDICGGNMFIWHRKMKDTSLQILKSGIPLKELPNWKEHVDIITKSTRKLKEFDPLVTSKTNVHLDDEHKKLIDYLQKTGSMWWWDADRHMLVCHTFDLASAHEDLELKGLFKTISTGRGRPDHNCFCFPLKDGGWTVRRFNKGTTEDPLWETDDTGWSKCYFNIDTDLKSAARMFNGIEHPNGSHVFSSAEEMSMAADAIGATISLPAKALYCDAAIKEHKDGRLIITVVDKDHKVAQEDMAGWLHDKTKWQRIFNKPKTSKVKENLYKYDNIVRHLITPSHEDHGWALKTESGWSFEALQNVRLAMESFELSAGEVKGVLGAGVVKNWMLVNKPFESEYPGNRCWNRNAVKMRFQPSVNMPTSLREGCPMWHKFLNHVGKNLNAYIHNNEWCATHNIFTGADYLFAWIASIFQEPSEPLPYLFFYGPQIAGKSLFHEAIQTLMIGGYTKADTALVDQRGFNQELESSVICVVEEVNLSKSKTAANRIKDWVTAKDISIHPKGSKTYMVHNITHWIQCLPKNQWIMTSKGARQIKELVGIPFTAILNGEEYECKNGFFKTGTREVYEVSTKEGYKYRSTDDHIVTCFDYSEKTTGSLMPNDKLRLNNHYGYRWQSYGCYEDGYILGWLFGDGTVFNRNKNNEFIALLYFYENDFDICEHVVTCFPGNVKVNFRSDGSKTITNKYLKSLAYDFGLTSKETISNEIEKASVDFYKGFLSAFFDADGSVLVSRKVVSLAQSNKVVLESIQRMLLRLGVVSTIYLTRAERDIKIHNNKYITHAKPAYELVIRNLDNLKRFKECIGFISKVKSNKLDAVISSWSRKAISLKHLAHVSNIDYIGTESVYDCVVEDIHHFDTNGFYVHNCSNEHDACPIFAGDTRVVVIHVEPVAKSELIPRTELLEIFETEAENFMSLLLNYQIPVSRDRLNIPVITTSDKLSMEENNKSLLEMFLDEMCIACDGNMILYGDFYNAFIEWLGPTTEYWTKQKVGKQLPPSFPKGRLPKTGQFYIGNISFDKDAVKGIKYILSDGMLIRGIKDGKN